MNYQRHPQLIDQLAAEYVLGTLRHRARRRFETWMTEEPIVRYHVEFWQNKLHPLLHAVPPLTPPARVWTAIENGLFRRPASSTSWWDNSALWRWLGGAAVACSLLLSAWVVIGLQSPAPEPAYIAVLSDAGQKPGIVVSYDAATHQLHLSRMTLSAQPTQKDQELWVINGSSAPVSLGVVPNSRSVTVVLQPEQYALLQKAGALAISLEPDGGSPTGAPTGPVLWSGAIAGKV